MVAIKDVRISNANFKESKQAEGLVAVFIGGTSGIGMGTLKQFAKQTTSPKIYIVGRSQSAATPLLKELESLNSKGTYVFQETEISLLKKVDKVCQEIKAKEEKVDLLFMSPAYITLGERNGKYFLNFQALQILPNQIFRHN